MSSLLQFLIHKKKAIPSLLLPLSAYFPCFPANKWKAQGLTGSSLWSGWEGCSTCLCPMHDQTSKLYYLNGYGQEEVLENILVQFFKVLHFPVQTELCSLWHKFIINRNDISLQRTFPTFHQVDKEKQIDEKQSENSFSLCCLGTRPSGAGAAVQKHHSNGSDKLHPQLPQGKHTIANIYCEHFLQVTVSFEST